MGLKEILQNEQQRLQAIREKTEKNLKDVPEGRLRIARNEDLVQYYKCVKGGPRNGKYLSKKDMELIKGIAQKSYDEKVFKCANKRLSQIERILKDYENDEIERFYLCEHPERQKLVVPVEPTYQQAVENWMGIPYKKKGFQANAPIIMTNNGLRVRSKSEKIMADYYDSKGLAYKYECPHYLEPYGYVYIDFTFLSPLTLREVYWEHCGMMDNPEYVQAFVKKMELFENNGIYPGENLILTFETLTSPINSKLIKKLTEKYLL